jgi:hypothetical protein
MEIPQELVERCKKLELLLYFGSELEDIRFFRLWMKLKETGDLKRMMIPDNHTPYKMMSVFQAPTTTLYALDENNDICFLFWVSPSSGFIDDKTVLCGYWVDKRKRKSKRMLKLTSLVYELVFSHYHYCIGITWQKDLLHPHEYIGYSVTGYVESLYGVKDVYFVILRRQDFYKSRFYKVVRHSERLKR